MNEKNKFRQMLKKYVFEHFGDSALSTRFISLELGRIKQQNSIQIPFIMKYVKGDVRDLHVLDLGCGLGGASVAWALQGANVTAIDIGAEDLRLARLRASSEHVKVKFVRVKSEKIPFADATFDLIICDQVLEHIPDYHSTIKEIYRVAKKGGMIYVDIPNKYYPIEPHYLLPFAHWMPEKVKNRYIRLFRRAELNYPISHISYFKIRKSLLQTKFHIISTTKDYIKTILPNNTLKNRLAKALNSINIPFYLYSPTVQFILRK